MDDGLLAAAVLVLGVSAAALSHAGDLAIETRHLTVSDASGKASGEELKGFAGIAQETLDRVLAFWSVDAGMDRFGKIRIVLDTPHRGAYASVFYWDTTGGERRRAVRVFGSDQTPQMLAHKLTSAVLPQKDKLIRNMMGVLAETKVGNPLTFPGCGFDSDAWVLAVLDGNAYIPLGDLGPDHESWGMREAPGGRMSVFDRARQHRAYAEAASFGSFLYRTYGIDKLKQLQRASQSSSRPQNVFGAGFEQLESAWLTALRAARQPKEQEVSVLAGLIRKDTATACAEAQNLASAGRQGMLKGKTPK